MQSKVFEVKEGTTKEELVKNLGEPAFFIPSSRVKNGTAFYYQSSGKLCGITLVDHIVKYTYCVVDPDSEATALKAGQISETKYQF